MAFDLSAKEPLTKSQLFILRLLADAEAPVPGREIKAKLQEFLYGRVMQASGNVHRVQI